MFRLHAGQTRADGITPYCTHPLSVKAKLARQPYWTSLSTEDQFRAEAMALLHDAVEDGRATWEQLQEWGYESIIPSLKLLTHFDGDSYLVYLIALLDSGDMVALVVKLADMDANLEDLPNHPSPGARKGLKTKYELARYILTHHNPTVFCL